MPVLAVAATPTSQGGAQYPPERVRTADGDSSGGEDESGEEAQLGHTPHRRQQAGEGARRDDPSSSDSPPRRRRGRGSALSARAPCASVTIAAPWPYAVRG